MTEDDLDDDETELILNWRKLTDGQRAALRQQIEAQYVTPEKLRELVRAMVPHYESKNNPDRLSAPHSGCPLAARHSHGGVGLPVFQSPRLPILASRSAVSYRERSNGVCSLAKRWNHQA